MLLGPHETARRLEHQHRPGWSIWYGSNTRQYWALATWACAMFDAATPEALEADIVMFEVFYPKPGRRSDAVGD
jgi:hypothetical protein